MSYREMLQQIIGMTVVTLFLLGCGTPATPELPTPTSTPDVGILLPKAGSLCGTAFSAPVSTDSPSALAPVLTVVDSYGSGWRLDFDYQLPFVEPHSATEVKTLACIKESKEKVGDYTPIDGIGGRASAYQISWSVRLVQWPDGKVLGAAKFTGGAPPETSLGGDQSGPPPREEFSTWVFPVLANGTILLSPGVTSVAFSPDGKTLASGSSDGTVTLWNRATGQVLRTLSHKLSVLSVAFSPDGKTLASVNQNFGTSEGELTVWDMATGQVLHTLAHEFDLFGDVAFSPDGKTVASGGLDRKVTVWDVATGQVLHTFSGHKNDVVGMAFSPDGKTLASGSSDGTVRLWDVATGQKLRTLNQNASVYSVTFAPNGKTLASGGYEGTILWDVATGQELRILNQTGVTSVAFAPDGKTLASGGNEGMILWDVTTGQVLLHTFRGHSVAFSPDGKTLASAAAFGVVKLWDVATGK